MDISIVSDNIMLVDGEVLQAKECSPEDFNRVLKIGRSAIVAAIADMYDAVRAREEESVKVQRGSVLAMRLGAKTLDVIKRDYYFNSYTGLDYSSQGLKPRYAEYFNVVQDNQLIPEIRETAGVPNASGVVLFVRDTPPLPK